MTIPTTSRTAAAGYDAATTSSRRRSPAAILKSADSLLGGPQRRQLQANTRDITRNFALAGWALRRHLDYVSTFHFQAATGDDGLDRDIETLIANYALAENCDVAGRHTLPRLIRLAEASRVVDGDVFLVKLSTGHLQAIEADRIRTPGNLAVDGDWVHGIKVTAAGKPRSYAIHKRDTNGQYSLEYELAAKWVIPLGYYQQFDQIRGISPLAAAVAPLRDVYENFDYALAKAKVAQMFGLVIYTETSDGAEWTTDLSGDPGAARYEVDLGSGPVKLELDPGDRADFLEAKTPPVEFRDFCQAMVAVALKALDIPFSFYDESFTTFFGSRAALLHYERACQHKRADLAETLDAITTWQLTRWITDGTLALPQGMTLEDLDWAWIPRGIQWWDPRVEVAGDLLAIEGGLTTRAAVIKERTGRDFRDVIDQLAVEQEYIKARGVVVGTNLASFDLAGTANAEPE